jgi:hypothetical protein
MLGFSEKTQGWLSCKITAVMDDKWEIEWWDSSQADKIKDKTELHHFKAKKQDGGTRLQRKLGLGNATTARTRTDHKGSGVRRTNGMCQPGGVNEKMRDSGSANREQGPSMMCHFQREEEE